MTSHSDFPIPRPVMTVLGPVSYEHLGITDAHNHLWIEPVDGADKNAPVLTDYNAIVKELVEYRSDGGASILDCQPTGCGRNGNKLFTLSKETGINIIASTGFHRKKYYAPDHWMFKNNSQQCYDLFLKEIQEGLIETAETSNPVLAGFVKVAVEQNWADCSRDALDGAAEAVIQTGVVMEIHTEKGALAEKVSLYLCDKGVSPGQLVFCHMDKRPDLGLHKELARLGVLLEYDTFFRPKYNPEETLWPLITQMVVAGFAESIALATDMAESESYHFIGGGPGLASFPSKIQKRLIENEIPGKARTHLLGGNIARRLSGIK
ncbi:MAG: hypothetical protein WCP19_00710 [Chloroflexota bacterium]